MKNPKISICAAVAALAVAALRGEGVKYAGIFINDEDWGLRPWAVRHFGKKEQIGVRAYAKVFELMKANGLNLLWPAMHEGGYEFVSRPENMALAAKYGIRIGTSHCEPMLRNNCYLSKTDKEKWSWLRNRDFVKDYWQWAVDNYVTNDVLWTIGMRGIHDGKMRDGDTTSEKIAVLEDVFAAQCAMLDAAGAGDAPKLFVPYKEVLPIFNAGLKVPEGTTIMWVNDNFGYVRRLGGPQCEGYGAGIYWHASYFGRPHGYIHLCTTPPAFMWYELVAKCWENGVRDVWMVNVGDVFQAELIVYALGRFASEPSAWGADAQEKILSSWAAENFGDDGRIAAHLAEYFNLGFIRKPEHMCIQWTQALPGSVRGELLRRYAALLKADEEIEVSLPAAKRDEYFRKVGYQVRFLAHAGLIHLEGRGREYAHGVIDPLTARWDALEGGRWAGFWADTIDEKMTPNRWSTHMQWPWNEPKNPDGTTKPRTEYVATAYAWERNKGLREPDWLENPVSVAADGGEWKRVAGLGTSGAAYALLPVKPGVGEGAALKYSCLVPRASCLGEEAQGTKQEARSTKHDLVIQFLPDFALWPGMKLRVGVKFDAGETKIVEVPKSDSNIGEKDPVRNAAVQDNFIRVGIPIPEGAKSATITAIDPGVVIDKVGVR